MQGSDQRIEVPEVLEPIQLSEEKEVEKYRIYSEIDILFILRGIMQAKSLISLFHGYDNDFILTSVLAIDTDKKEMILNYGADDKDCQKVLQSNELTFVTSQNRVKIQFICDQIKKTQFKGKNAFAVNIPKSLLRMQRRDHFRISTPTAKPLKCIIPIPGNSTYTKAEVTLLDISCGGIAVIDQHPIINFDPGIIYSNCQISLPEIGIINATIQVKNTYEITLRSGHNCLRSGCQFIDLSASMEAMIQRYIIKQEQMRKVK